MLRYCQMAFAKACLLATAASAAQPSFVTFKALPETPPLTLRSAFYAADYERTDFEGRTPAPNTGLLWEAHNAARAFAAYPVRTAHLGYQLSPPNAAIALTSTSVLPAHITASDSHRPAMLSDDFTTVKVPEISASTGLPSDPRQNRWEGPLALVAAAGICLVLNHKSRAPAPSV